MKNIEIDAKNRTIGRVATEAAMALMGKDSASYKSNMAPEVSVHIKNVSSAKITEQRKEGKVYQRYTGNHGGLRKTSMREMIEKKGVSELFIKAVKGMLPKNRLQKIYMKNLKVTE